MITHKEENYGSEMHKGIYFLLYILHQWKYHTAKCISIDNRDVAYQRLLVAILLILNTSALLTQSMSQKLL